MKNCTVKVFCVKVECVVCDYPKIKKKKKKKMCGVCLYSLMNICLYMRVSNSGDGSLF